MDQLYILSEEEQDAELQKSSKATQQIEDEDEVIFVGVISNSKPVISNILNRINPGSKRKMCNHLRKDTGLRLQPTSYVNPSAEARSQSESRTANPVITKLLCKPHYKNDSPQVMPGRSSECSPVVTLPSSCHQPEGAAFSVKGVTRRPRVAKRRGSTSKGSSINPKRPKRTDRHKGKCSSALSLSGNIHTVNPQQNPPSNGVHASLSLVQSGPSTAFPKDNVHFKPISINLDGENGLAKTDLSSQGHENKISDPKKGKLTLLLDDFYYGHHKGHGRAGPKTLIHFKCSRCQKVLKNMKFMNHMRHHLELEKQSDNWENDITCQHCHRKFPLPFQLQCHIDRVHSPQKHSDVCKICELSFETDQVLLQHMKDNHKPGEMPYVCQVCKYRSSIFDDVITHFKMRHANTNYLLCLFCLRIFRTAPTYTCHYRGHWERCAHQCSKCRLQFLTFKEKIQHKTQCHQMFKKPKQLEGLPPETQVVIQVSLGPFQPGSMTASSITVNTSDFEPSPPQN
ncbi:zinc finger protein 280B-like [Dipodomys spectabilis]|uniref:zinc finger protein 280B-like n=1 Tax=Dipodomys spectabilis TaxID=105255 RepID=UPI001C53A11D|nr:zinc finger protein 280B-like [Dipodomys spectabilis]